MRATRRATLALVAAAAVLVPAGVLGVQATAGPDAPGSVPAADPVGAGPTPVPAQGLPRPAAGDEEATRVEVENARSQGAEPRTVSIPSLGVDSTVEDLRTDADGRLESPVEWQRAGWFADGVVPGDTGPAVVAGHVDSPTGPAVFADLGRLRPGDVVEVERADGAVARFAVDRTESFPQDDFPTQAVYGPTPDAQLRLITCDGAYVDDGGGYQNNLVVFATLVDLEGDR